MSSRVPIRAFRKPGSARTGAVAVAMAKRSKERSIRRFITPAPQILYTPAATSTAAVRGWTGRRGELKYVDTAKATYVCNTTGTVTALNLIAQGDDVTNRQGRQVTLKSVRIHGYFGPTDTATLKNYARVMLVWDSQPNSGSIATIANILTAATSVSALNLDNRQRFTVLRDFKMAYGGFSNAATQAFAEAPTVGELDWFVNLRDAITTYSGTTATIGVVATGALLLISIGDQAGDDGTDFIAHARVRFTDD